MHKRIIAERLKDRKDIDKQNSNLECGFAEKGQKLY